MEEIKFKGKTADNLVIVDIARDGKEPEKKYFHSIRCGISFPPTATNAKGYFCLIGQEVVRRPDGNFPTALLAEGEDMVMTELFRKMFDAMGVYGVIEVFTDLSSRIYAEHLFEYHRMFRPTQNFILQQAPYAQEFIHGFEMANRLAGSKVFYIPRSSIARLQFKEIKKEDLDSRPELVFNAINAVRYVLAAIEMVEVVPVGGPKAKIKTVSPLAWT